ncbi:MAG TPA: sigma-70 family RNA polymerase sigma factor [Chitinophagaceae bacterium]|jgi:RNA polymerase sigma-70 factor (ECF subfamily)|nr:sigma-70 family RNA polymerase sigma factor [Chitinophagaceae bacterium]
MYQPNVSKLVDHLFRHESGKMISVLSKLLGLQNLETANDIVQDSLLQAMNTWSFKGIPDNPPAWLYHVAKNKAIDFLRKEKKFREISPQYSYLLQSEYTLASTVTNFFLEDEIQDSQLRMIFACCHPAIAEESQLALTLKTLCGLSVTEISKAFLTTEDTIAKRIYRAKEKIKAANIQLDVPHSNELPTRIDTVLKSLYLLFNEGYNSSHPDHLIREDLCEEAMRLCFLLTQHSLTAYPRSKALLALMCFQASRLDARLDDKSDIILLKHQDRSKWNRSLMSKGFELMEESTEPFEVSTYHLEAAIASQHATAKSFEQTDWKSIYHLYEMLYQLQPNPIVAMNKAIASAYAISKENALNELQKISGLEHHHLYLASIGEIHFEMQNKTEAKKFYQKALHFTSSGHEQQLLVNKIKNCEAV